MVAREILFSGELGFFGGLSNGRDLVEVCPVEFKQDNQWSNYAKKLFSRGGNTDKWKWKSEDPAERRRQGLCFEASLIGPDLSSEDKAAVAGWMLSEMLTEVPEQVSRGK